MSFIRTTNLQACAQPLSQRLTSELEAGKNVLWLVPGGSNIPVSVEVMSLLPEAQLNQLTLLLTDERYGEWGHADSNFQQLKQAGLNTKTATFLPTLSEQNLSLEETTAAYAQTAATAFAAADVIIGQFGMGADGHIAGILPGSPASQEETALTSSYQAETYTRITLTFPALRQLQTAYVLAFGAEKAPALQRLATQEVELAVQPAQIIKQLPEWYVYNDQTGETA